MLADMKGPLWIFLGGPNSLSHGSSSDIHFSTPPYNKRYESVNVHFGRCSNHVTAGTMEKL